MSLRHASQHIASRNASLRSSYAEISRFIRTRHHGITLAAASCAVRCFTNSRTLRNSIEPEEKLRRALNSFKDTLKPSLWKDFSPLNAEASKMAIGKKISTIGYLTTRRDVNKNLSFAILRNPHQTFSMQIISSANVEGSAEAEAHARLRKLREWTPVMITGTLQQRESPPKESDSTILLSNTREIVLESIVPLNEIDKDVIVKEEAVYGPEQRYLQLRTNQKLLDNLCKRAHAVGAARNFLSANGWKEFETPLLFKSTPEGAREFLVPSRAKGLAYALPQSPQQYKQILMASGVAKYFQFARCFRDEDLRADRQPEFTQLDMEMSWAGAQEVMESTEALLRKVWFDRAGKTFSKFQRLTYQQAMASYGSDKPDLRFSATVHLKSKITPLQDPIIEAFKLTLSPDPAKNRKTISAFLDSPEGKTYLNNPDGQPAVFFGDASQPMGGLGPMGYEFTMDCPPELQIDHGDVLVLQARKNEPFDGFGSTMLGNLRLALHKEAVSQGLIEGSGRWNFRFVWVTDFPLFTPTNDTDPGQGGAAGLSSTHHPFTAPKTPEDVELLLTDPSKVVAAHYDIVVNGVELGGGSQRIHNAEVQEFIFRDVLKMKPERIEDFRHLLNALRSGCPPHAGLALGWDRLVAVLQGVDSVRDVIAFPKTGSGEDPMVKAPNRLTEEQLGTYHLQLKD
ncbi:aspartyl-tRNA synthetase-like protein [Lentithecium fluviatile CBS 122367]|uniref:Aspartyl-tRNA synthetase-like protein n=1 Tax=Lentithecium fluviatile CBS 122367 TaxID=1168545 RepID=A0A6G1JMK1_9PLEO|nr:aspartyl-tRNA synthetase-like protein [Lentithecium fluviatile CBS 122367]